MGLGNEGVVRIRFFLSQVCEKIKKKKKRVYEAFMNVAGDESLWYKRKCAQVYNE